MRFEFATSNRVVFGPGTVNEVAPSARSFGERALVVVDSLDHSARLLEQLRTAGVTPLPCPISGEPTVASVLESLRAARDARCDLVIGMGGGSALDTGKAVAVLLTNPGDIYDHLEVIGKGQPLEKPSAAYIAIPTTAGTGSEATRNAVLASPEQRVKVSLRSPSMLPRLAIVDPELTYSLPPTATASTGLDALTQLIEPFVSNTVNPLTDALCRDGIPRAAKSLHRAYENGQDATARENMSLASLFGGMALANARLGAVHGMANPIGGMSRAPHGAICARLLPLVMETNLRALRLRQPDSPAITRYTEVARLLTGDESARAEDGATWVRELCKAFNIRPLSEYGLKQGDYPALVEQSQKANSMQGNPVLLTGEEILYLLNAAA
jgi:alcohol dehydrogenase class IV